MDVERLLDRALLATHKRLTATRDEAADALLTRHQDAVRALGKTLISQLRLLIPAKDRTAAARIAHDRMAEDLYEKYSQNTKAVDLLLTANRRALWLLTRALMRLLESEATRSGLDDRDVDQEIAEELEDE